MKARFRPLSQSYQQLSYFLYEAFLSLYTYDALPEEYLSLQKIVTITTLFEDQMIKEEELFFGFLYDYESFVTAILRDDYKECTKHINGLRKTIASKDETKSIASDDAFIYRLRDLFNKFLNCCERHMQTHESLINPVLWRYYSDEELKQMSSAFIIHSPSLVHAKVLADKQSAYDMAV